MTIPVIPTPTAQHQINAAAQEAFSTARLAAFTALRGVIAEQRELGASDETLASLAATLARTTDQPELALYRVHEGVRYALWVRPEGNSDWIESPVPLTEAQRLADTSQDAQDADQ